jgi:hypothetical protein
VGNLNRFRTGDELMMQCWKRAAISSGSLLLTGEQKGRIRLRHHSAGQQTTKEVVRTLISLKVSQYFTSPLYSRRNSLAIVDEEVDCAAIQPAIVISQRDGKAFHSEIKWPWLDTIGFQSLEHFAVMIQPSLVGETIIAIRKIRDQAIDMR